MLTDLVTVLVKPGSWLWRRGHKRTFVAYMAVVQVVARAGYLAGLRQR